MPKKVGDFFESALTGVQLIVMATRRIRLPSLRKFELIFSKIGCQGYSSDLDMRLQLIFAHFLRVSWSPELGFRVRIPVRIPNNKVTHLLSKIVYDCFVPASEANPNPNRNSNPNPNSNSNPNSILNSDPTSMPNSNPNWNLNSSTCRHHFLHTIVVEQRITTTEQMKEQSKKKQRRAKCKSENIHAGNGSMANLWFLNLKSVF